MNTTEHSDKINEKRGKLMTGCDDKFSSCFLSPFPSLSSPPTCTQGAVTAKLLPLDPSLRESGPYASD